MDYMSYRNGLRRENNSLNGDAPIGPPSGSSGAFVTEIQRYKNLTSQLDFKKYD